MTLIQDQSDRIEPLETEGPLDDDGRPPAAAPAVEAPCGADVSGAGAPAPRIGRLTLAVLVSVALHLAVVAFFLAGPGRDTGSVLLSGIRDRGIAAIGDAKAENAGNGRGSSAQDRAISVVLTPPVATRPDVPRVAETATPAAGRREEE